VNWQQRGAHAARSAARMRTQLGYGPADAACPIDMCIRLDLDVWFQAQPSLEGIYTPGDPPVVIISSLRPAGRRRYTAGHELGHHAHGHGASLDAQLSDETKVDEFVANRFARALLMPQLVVANAYSRRGWAPGMTTAAQAFVVAQDLGVGFTTLLDHMCQTLRFLYSSTVKELARKPLPKLRAELFGDAVDYDLFPVDQFWGTRPLDVEIGDVITAPKGSTIDGSCIDVGGNTLRAARTGCAILAIPGRIGTITVRVSRRDFVGRARYRHLEDPDES
jgi:hypothetical protein